MRNSIIPHVSVRLVNRFFKKRFWLASATRRNRTFNRIVKKVMFEGDDMIVVPKNTVARRRTVETDISVEDAGARTVLPSDVVKRALSMTDDIFIMDFCLCRKSTGCKDYPVDKGCIFLGNGVHRIPEDFGHVATREEAERYVDECSDLGFVHIIGKNRLDSLWLHTGRKNDLMTICNCCPCCCLWNVTRDISDDIASVYRRMDSVEVTVDAEKCIGCGICTEACFTRATSIKGNRCDIDQALCRGCGRCADMCPRDTITVTYDPASIPREAEALGSLFQFHQSPRRSMVSSLSGPRLMMSAGTFRYLSMNSMYSLISPGSSSYPALTRAEVSFHPFHPLRFS